MHLVDDDESFLSTFQHGSQKDRIAPECVKSIAIEE